MVACVCHSVLCTAAGVEMSSRVQQSISGHVLTNIGDVDRFCIRPLSDRRFGAFRHTRYHPSPTPYMSLHRVGHSKGQTGSKTSESNLPRCRRCIRSPLSPVSRLDHILPHLRRLTLSTVSDTAFNQGKEFDTAGPALLEVVGGHQSYKAAEHVIVPDDELKIQEQVARLAGGEGDSRVDWIIVTGGTYSSVRSVK